MYFIFKHVGHSTYRDKPGKYYHYTQASPNHEMVRRGARVLCYQKETDQIFAKARVGRVECKLIRGVKNFFAYYSSYRRLKRPVFLDEIRGQLRLRDLRRPSPGIIPLDKHTFEGMVEIIERIQRSG